VKRYLLIECGDDQVRDVLVQVLAQIQHSTGMPFVNKTPDDAEVERLEALVAVLHNRPIIEVH
jgi:ABC-type Fe3+/spermidine/putrescine transport system ATPase subunit